MCSGEGACYCEGQVCAMEARGKGGSACVGGLAVEGSLEELVGRPGGEGLVFTALYICSSTAGP